ncbi:hypothetical protein LTR62_000989 [Meristemomyces frigidus]|uniref:Uncharacterized protein n=1 Tax=Meristemomyces frigidus TaxID=1508187 RepID=A0AAN7YBU8_9PEZI|nr:hypothetical protein LTR62_000989 [Meristemomyces frigidus]
MDKGKQSLKATAQEAERKFQREEIGNTRVRINAAIAQLGEAQLLVTQIEKSILDDPLISGVLLSREQERLQAPREKAAELKQEIETLFNDLAASVAAGYSRLSTLHREASHLRHPDSVLEQLLEQWEMVLGIIWTFEDWDFAPVELDKLFEQLFA